MQDLPSFEKAARPLRILVAEDTRAFQELVKSILGQRGHRIEIVGNGREAVDRAEEQDFDVVLMDAQMPSMDGLEAAVAIRHGANADRAAVPIIAITAHAQQANRASCLAAGMDDYLAKPFDAAELVRVVEWHASHRKSPGALDGCADELEALPVHTPTLDIQAALARLGGNPQLLAQAVQAFREDGPKQMGAIRAGLERGDLGEVALSAHNLRGSAATLSAKPMGMAATALEEAADAADLACVHEALHALEAELGSLFEALDSLPQADS